MQQGQGVSISLSSRIWLVSIVLVVSNASSAGPQRSSDESSVTARSREVHETTLTIDSHVDIPFEFATDAADPGVRGDRQVDLPKMRDGGLDAAFFIVYVGQGERNSAGYALAKEQAITKFNAIHRMAEDLYPSQIELAYSTTDVERIGASGKLVALIGIENGWVIGQDLGLLEQYHGLGARYITLAHNGHNDISDSASPDIERGESAVEHDGISRFGRRVIAEMNRLGIMVDVSHISRQAMLEASRLSEAPVIASHSSVRALADVPRNMDDEQLRSLRDAGGVIQIVAVAEFLKVDPRRDRSIAVLREEFEMPRGEMTQRRLETMSDRDREEYYLKVDAFERGMTRIDQEFPPANISDFVDHVDYAVNLIGIDHVGMSSDFDGGGGIVGWRDASETVNVTIELVRRGYSREDIQKLWGGNLLRVWKEAERIASQQSQQR
jgi:membrane dipeptidase